MLSIERITEKFAFCIDDDGKKVKISRAKLPQDTAENDILIISADGSYTVDKSETASRKTRGGASHHRKTQACNGIRQACGSRYL